MTGPPLDVVALGDALVDVLVHEDEAFLERHGLVKGVMTLIDIEQAESLYAAMGPGVEASGGSAANTVVGVAMMGGAAGFVGKVRDDQLGQVFTHDIRASGVEFTTPPSPDGPPTGRCLIVITPDAERTLHTYLGAAVRLAPDDVDARQIERAAVTFLEGYLWDEEAAKVAVRLAADVAHRAGRLVSMTLSDPFCVERHREEWLPLIAGSVDVLFANEVELLSLYEVGDVEAALSKVRRDCAIAAVTRSEKGSIVVAGDSTHVVEAHPVEHVADTTGAGDLYAAGFLWGLTHDRDLPTCGALASLLASEVISHVGARPHVALTELAADFL